VFSCRGGRRGRFLSGERRAHARDPGATTEKVECVMNRRLMAVVTAVGLVGASGVAMAGLKSYIPATLSQWGNTVSISGGIGETRNTADSVQYIECGSNANAGYCMFRDASNQYHSCSTTDAGMISVIRSMSGDGSINFSYDVTTNVCTYMLSYASSRD